MEIVWMFVKVFVVGGAICTVAQILINLTELTSGRILVYFLLSGLVLQAFGIYQYLVDFAGAGATVPDFRLWISVGKGSNRGSERELVQGDYGRNHGGRGGNHRGDCLRLFFRADSQSEV